MEFTARKASDYIPIIFSANDNYFVFLYVAIYSLIKASSPKRNYQIWILTTNFSSDNQEKIESLTAANVTIAFMDITSAVLDVDLREVSHLSVETFYRLFIPQLFPQLEKVLYLDCDILALKDVAELFFSDLRGYCVGAIRDVDASYLRKHTLSIGIHPSKIFNAGVLVIHLEQFEKMRVREQCLALLYKDYEEQRNKYTLADQDLLNCVLEDQIAYLDDRWNFQWQHSWREECLGTEERNRYRAAAKQPWIIHYASPVKPLGYPRYPYSEKFWDVLEETPIYRDVVLDVMEKYSKCKEVMHQIEKWKFPYEKVPFGSKIAIYAAGKMGRAFIRLLHITCYAEVVLWVDKNFQGIILGMEVKPVEVLLKEEGSYQYVVVAVKDENVAGSIYKCLLELGVEKGKIVWDI